MPDVNEFDILTINGYPFNAKDSTARSDISSIISAMQANNTSISGRINDLNGRAFDYTISISSNNESEISSIIDGLYKIKYVTIETVEEEEVETVNDIAILIQSGVNQYLYKDGQLYSRVKTNGTWGNWVLNGGLPAVTSSDNGKILMVVNGQWSLVSPSTLYSGTGAPNNANGNNGDIYVQTVEQPETRVIVKYNITNTSSATTLFNSEISSSYSAIEIDGVEQQNVISEYTFSTTGEHTVKYTLVDSTILPGSAFRYINDITSVVIPNIITSIKSYAFYSSGLTSITIPDSVTSIEGYAFASCSALTSLTIPSSVTSISDGIIYNCTSLTSIIVDSNNTTYDSRNNCNAIIETATNILMFGCNSTSIIPSGVTSIANKAFSRCPLLTSITIPSTVTALGTYVFEYCSSLASIISYATTAPTVSQNTFKDIGTNGVLTIPSGAIGYDTWMQTISYYLGKYGWTSVEQS